MDLSTTEFLDFNFVCTTVQKNLWLQIRVCMKFFIDFCDSSTAVFIFWRFNLITVVPLFWKTWTLG